MAKLKVAILAPPWLALPINGYGGIEQVLETLIPALIKQGVDVTLFANGKRTIRGVKTVSLFSEELFERIQQPYYEIAPHVQAQISHALTVIEQTGDFDIIHDHNTEIGPTLLAYALERSGLPPALHTFHGPPFSLASTAENDNTIHLRHLPASSKLKMVCISEAMAKKAPKEISTQLLPAVHNAIDVDRFPLKSKKSNYYITLARFTRDKGQDVAVKFAVKHKQRLRMAGTVAGISSSRKLLLELSNPMSEWRNNADFRYYSDEVLPFELKHANITYEGNVSGPKKIALIAHAKALLFPIDWEEPFGMAVIEALVCGTPVVAMRRGAMPEIITHGVNGFLADTVEEFEEYALRVDEIDPQVCRQTVVDKFSATHMASAYIDRYRETFRLANG